MQELNTQQLHCVSGAGELVFRVDISGIEAFVPGLHKMGDAVLPALGIFLSVAAVTFAKNVLMDPNSPLVDYAQQEIKKLIGQEERKTI